ncbi:MAG: hypothetical protein ACI9GM_000147 [Salibacteraceae bacterium]|jgi:hypothetical protein
MTFMVAFIKLALLIGRNTGAQLTFSLAIAQNNGCHHVLYLMSKNGLECLSLAVLQGLILGFIVRLGKLKQKLHVNWISSLSNTSLFENALNIA